MKVTRDVISDLWPLYETGDASPDTRALVEAFLQQDPEFVKTLKGSATHGLLRQEIPELAPDREAQALRQTKRRLRGWDWSIFLAMMFSCFAFGRIISDTSWDVSPVPFIITAAIAATFWVAFFVRLYSVRKSVYGFKREPGQR